MMKLEMKSALKTYKEKTKKSAKLFAESKKLHVNGVHHNIRFFKPYPFITKASKGKFLVDVDSNKYVDYWMGHWSLILGHTEKNIKQQAIEQIKKGWMHGTANQNAILLSEKITKAVPMAEKIRYVSTGTEATMYAVRLARAITGRKTIAKIDGGWHGYTTDLLKTVNWPFNQSESEGLTDEKHIISLPLNDLEKSLSMLQSVKKDLAGIVIEPILGGGGGIPVVRSGENWVGIPAVIDKDRLSALLSIELGASLLIISTAIDSIRTNFGTKSEKSHSSLTRQEALTGVQNGEFPDGSMGPKVSAMVNAKSEIESCKVLLCKPGDALKALRGEAGTEII